MPIESSPSSSTRFGVPIERSPSSSTRFGVLHVALVLDSVCC